MTTDYAELKRQLDELDSTFARFVQHRGPQGTWRQLIHREMPITLQADLFPKQQGIDYQSPLPEKYILDHVDVLYNPTWFDVVGLPDNAQGKAAQRALLLYIARSWEQMNDGGWWDNATGEGQVADGVDVSWLRYKPDKPKKGETGSRERQGVFYLEHCQIGGVRWQGSPEDPDAVWYRYSKSVVGADIKNASNQRVTLDSAGKIGWLGEGQEHDSAAIKGKELEIIVRDARDLAGRLCLVEGCDHVMRSLTYYVCAKGARVEDYEEVQQIDSPFHHCSFFITPGRRMFGETDPHLQMRPMMLPVYVLVYWENFITTLLATMARLDYSDEALYESLAQTLPQVLAAAEGGTLTGDQLKETDGREIPQRAGEVKRLPRNISEHLITLLNQVRAAIAECAPNRYLQGIADNQTVNGTATMGLNQAQAASLPYNRLLTNSDRTIRRIFEAQLHSICFWALAEPENLETRYLVGMTGGENVLRYKTTIRTGEQVYITAKEAASGAQLIVRTESSTLAEQKERWLLAVAKKAQGVFTQADLMRAGGIFDVEGQNELLYGEDIDELIEPYEKAMVRSFILRLAETQSDFDFSAAGLAPPADVPLLTEENPDITVTPEGQQNGAERRVQESMGAAAYGPSGGSSAVGGR